MAVTKLRLAVDNYEHEEDEREKLKKYDNYAEHPIFFTKRQVFVGAKLRCIGRMDEGVVYTVTRIVTFGAGESVPKSIRSVRRLDDTITLVQEGRPANKRQGSFVYLSYSAIWQIG